MGNKKDFDIKNVTQRAVLEPLCPLCGRPIPQGQFDKHHLVPKSKGGKETEGLHRACHRHIHMVLTEQELAKHYNTADALLGREEVLAFVEWIKKKPNDFLPSFKKSNRTKK